ncbi:GNAT family N-acetyltransferase [Geminocystis sp. NIES-3709]|uniref:GNAT family N-acetyltransferase n=1 Tax=Geminocystis sp. NIES-3709 TaxID=1617448 RepID=UPI0005FC8835|nr:GNAT family N-acetyltransferase [Geminocystis sp. NIES-3709]BAQ66315.1 N-acetyltransferase (GNAT) family [Geminocystis sp. NIES-3709]
MVWLQKLFTKTENENDLSDKNYGRDWVTLDPEIFGRSKIYFSTNQDIDLYELEELCDSVGWARRPLRKVRKALDNSYLVASAWEVRGARTVLIGFARATSDHAFNATIWDVVIHPRFQNKGLGKIFMKYMIKKLRADDISNVTLFADPHVIEFYRRLGFVLDPEGIKGMFLYPD